MDYYQAKNSRISGSDFKEVSKVVKQFYKQITSRTKRQPYIRSAYFKKQKVFFTYFWKHLYQKPFPEVIRRLKYFIVTIELLKNSRHNPDQRQNPNNPGENLYRFKGKTKDGYIFYVQIKETKSTKAKYLISIFDEHKKK